MVKRSSTMAAIMMVALTTIIPGCHRSDEGPRLELVPELEASIEAEYVIGKGIVAPFKLVFDEQRNDRLYVLTGRGETFSEGYLHAVDPVTFVDLFPPLNIGINGTDILMSGTRLVVAARGSKQLVLVDIEAWRVLDELALDFVPICLALIDENEVVVASASSGDVITASTTDDTLAVTARTKLDHFASAMVVNRSDDLLYIVQPLNGVVVLDTKTLRRRETIDLWGEPSRDGMLWNHYLVVPARDGYLHFIDRNTGQVSTLDIAEVLGLDRSSLPIRGIDPGGLIDLSDGRFVLVNGRQQSILFTSDVTMEPPVRAVGTLPGGSSGAHVGSSIYVTQPSINTIVRVGLSPNLLGSPDSVTREVVGHELGDFVVLRERPAPTIVAIDSDGRIVMLDQAALPIAEIHPEQNATWSAPLTTAPDGGFTALRRRAGVQQLVHFAKDGAIAQEFGVEIPNVFSGTEANGTVLLVSRITKELQFVDLSSGESTVMQLLHDRPRAGAYLASGKWAIIHDTHPDIGITLTGIGTEESFSSFDDWYSAITEIPSGGAVAVSFNGTVTALSEDGVIVRRHSSTIQGALHVRAGFGDELWVTTENQGRAYRIDNRRISNVDARYSEPGLRVIAALFDSDLLVAGSARRIRFIKEQQ